MAYLFLWLPGAGLAVASPPADFEAASADLLAAGRESLSSATTVSSTTSSARLGRTTAKFAAAKTNARNRHRVQSMQMNRQGPRVAGQPKSSPREKALAKAAKDGC